MRDVISSYENVIKDRFGSAVHVTSGSFLANNCTFAHNQGSHAVLNGGGNSLQKVGGDKSPLAYDQKGNARNTSAMWPGAYEKH